MYEQPTGTITFLFTDIEGSTRLWEEHPRAMRAALARHDTLLRQAIETHSGYVFKTVGDAFYAAFPTAPNALDAALAAQRSLRDTDWGSLGVSIRVRIALHTGAADARDGDYFGQPLNRVARLLSVGHGGQILLSLPTQQLVRGELPPDTQLRDLGAVTLRGLLHPEHVYQVIAPDLPADFPPLKTLAGPLVEVPLDDTSPLPNPYKGLRAFQENDAADFFGREALTARLLERLAEPVPFQRFLAVVGPSGSGKSSVVRAGVVPAIKQGRLPGSERWLVVEMLPGPHPLEELEALLLNIAVNPPESLLGQLREDYRGLARAVKRVLPHDESVELVLMVDQFEEVFTLVESEEERVHFLSSLHAAVAAPRSRLRVIVTLRADLYDRPLLYPDPGELLRQRTEVVLPLSAEELERAIVRPAERVGARLEPELVAAIIKDVGEAPGTLPLLQYALTELFERRQGRRLALAAYRDSGGVLGALSRRAEEIYAGLSEREQEATRQLFLRLVTLGEGLEDTRRRVRRAELEALGEAETIAGVIEAFGAYRLLTFDQDPLTHSPSVEVAHEALLRNWQRLRQWLDDSRADLRVQRQLMLAAEEWAAGHQDASFLARGTRLAQFETLAQQNDIALTMAEQAYLQASLAERERQATAERERQERELILAQQSARAQRSAAHRLRYLVGALALFLLIVAGLAVYAVRQSQIAQTNAQQAQDSAAKAEANAQEAQANFTRAEAQRLAAEANTLLQSQDSSPELIALLSLRSMQTQYSPQGDGALIGAQSLDQPLRLFKGHTDWVSSVAFSPDGKYVLSAGGDKTPRLWDTQTGQEVREFVGHTDELWHGSVAFSPDGQYVLTGSLDGTTRLWDAQSGQEVRQLLGRSSTVTCVAYSPNGKYVLTGHGDGAAILSDPQSGQTVHIWRSHTAVIWGVALSPDSKYALTASFDGTVRLWNVQTGDQPLTITLSQEADRAVFAPDGKSILTGDTSGAVRLWDIQTGQQIRAFAGFTQEILGLRFSPDGQYVLASGGSRALLWDAQTGMEMRRFTSHIGDINAVDFSPDSRSILTGGDDSLVRLWAVHPTSRLPRLIGHQGSIELAVLSPDSKQALTVDRDRTIQLWDTQTGQELHAIHSPDSTWAWSAFAPDGTAYGLFGNKQTGHLLDVGTEQELYTFNIYTTSTNLYSVILSPDSKYFVMVKGGSNTVLDAATYQPLSFFDSMIGTRGTDSAGNIAFSRDGKYILAGDASPTIKLWDLHTGRQVQHFHAPVIYLRGLAISPDNRYVSAGGSDKIARLWDTQTGQEVRAFRGHTDAVNAVAFSADGKYLLTGSYDKTARLWDTLTGAELRRFAGHKEAVNTVTFSSDGKYVLTGGADGTARLWDVDYHTVIQDLCSRLVRDFTDDERQQYGIQDKEPTCPK